MHIMINEEVHRIRWYLHRIVDLIVGERKHF